MCVLVPHVTQSVAKADMVHMFQIALASSDIWIC